MISFRRVSKFRTGKAITLMEPSRKLERHFCDEVPTARWTYRYQVTDFTFWPAGSQRSRERELGEFILS